MKIHIKTFGCSANQADSEAMAGLLIRAGHEIISSDSGADIVIVNSCTVKSPTEHKVLKYIKKLKQANKKTIVAGCLPQAGQHLEELADLPIMGLFEIEKVAEIVEQVAQGQQAILLGDKKKTKAGLPKFRKNPLIEIVPISEGCTGACTYCATRLAKGRLFSYPPEKIICQIENALKDGVKEIWITSQDNAAYGLDIRTNLVELLEKICSIEGDFLVRIGMMDPDNILRILDKLIEIYQHEKIFKFLHIPVQSGSNRILKLMNRKYKIDEFKKIINKFREEIPDITISTDIICGFPGETANHFNDSLKLIGWLKPDVLNISRFWKRKGTLAAEFPNQISGGEIKSRSTAMTNIYDEFALKRNKRWLGWTGEILIDEKGKPGSWIGRNFSYKPIVVKSNKNLFGEKIKIKITDTKSNYLIGELIS